MARSSGQRLVVRRTAMVTRCLVTGGRGFLGRHLVRRLLAGGWRVTVLDTAPPPEGSPSSTSAGEGDRPLPAGGPGSARGSERVGPTPVVEGARPRHLRGSVTDPDAVRRAMEGAEVVFHLAARTDLWAPDPDAYLRVNRDGARNVFRAAREEGVRRLVHVSTETLLRDFGTADGAGRRRGPAAATETAGRRGLDAGSGPGTPAQGEAPDRSAGGRLDGPPPLEPLPPSQAMPGPYTRSKLEGERAAVAAWRDGLPIVVVNPTVPLGPGDDGRTPPGRMLLGFLNGRFPAYLEGRLDLIDVRDLALGLERAAERGTAGRRYVLGGTSLGMGNFLRLLEEVSGLPMPSRRVPPLLARAVGALGELVATHVTGRPPSATRAGVLLARAPSRFDPGPSLAALGLHPRPLEETLRDTVAWLGKRGLLERAASAPGPGSGR